MSAPNRVNPPDDVQRKLDHYHRLLFWLTAHAKAMHPYYGDCDALADGACSECLKIRDERDELRRGPPPSCQCCGRPFDAHPAPSSALRDMRQAGRRLTEPEIEF